jgi:hypothetical protein
MIDRAFAHDVTVAVLVFQFKNILIRLFYLSWSLGNECIRPIILIARPHKQVGKCPSVLFELTPA